MALTKITATNIGSNAVANSIGYVPVNKAGDTITGSLVINQNNSGNTVITTINTPDVDAVRALPDSTNNYYWVALDDTSSTGINSRLVKYDINGNINPNVEIFGQKIGTVSITNASTGYFPNTQFNFTVPFEGQIGLRFIPRSGYWNFSKISLKNFLKYPYFYPKKYFICVYFDLDQIYDLNIFFLVKKISIK